MKNKKLKHIKNIKHKNTIKSIVNDVPKYKINPLSYSDSDSVKYEEDLVSFFKSFSFRYSSASNSRLRSSFKLPEKSYYYNNPKLDNTALILKNLVIKIERAYSSPTSRKLANSADRILNVQIDSDTNKILCICLFIFDKNKTERTKYKQFLTTTHSNIRVDYSPNIMYIYTDNGTLSKNYIIDMAEFIVMLGKLNED